MTNSGGHTSRITRWAMLALVAGIAFLLGSHSTTTETKVVGTVVPVAQPQAITPTVTYIPASPDPELAAATTAHTTALSDLLAAEQAEADAAAAHDAGTGAPCGGDADCARHAAQSSNAPTKTTEDDAAWDCTTMGNRTCGNADEPAPVKSKSSKSSALHVMTKTEIDAALDTIPNSHECVLQTADGTVYGLVSDTDPQCTKWWGADRRDAAPKVAPFSPSGR